MTLSPGQELGPYHVIAHIGTGGMGEVYRARDTRLDRTVAIKVLSAAQSHREDLRQRFEREARAISALNHPHICTLYDIGHQNGMDYLVMEFVEGETLEHRLSRGPLPLAQALQTATEIADALDKAHRQGIVHRDLKPGNVMLTEGGVKLLDFGLAKLVRSDAATTPLSSFATQASVTAQGTILGTLQYMPPEQLEGKEADARADIWALGCLLYEAVTARKAFEGASQASLISAIMSAQPMPISQVQPVAPSSLDHVLQTCLAKNAEDRWQSARDVAVELKWIAATAGSATHGITSSSQLNRRRERLVWGFATATLFAALTYFVWSRLSLAPAEQPVVRFTIAPPEGTVFPSFGYAAGTSSPTVSPDGRHVAFIASGVSGRSQLWIRSFDADTSRLVTGSENASFTFWPPDSKWIGFYASGKLHKASISGGAPQVICEATQGTLGAAWGNGTILFAPTSSSGLYRVSDQGGEPEQVTKTDNVVVSHRWPQFLPDQSHFIYTGLEAVRGKEGIYLSSLTNDEPRLLVRASNALYSNSGHLLFVRSGTVFAQELDSDTLELTGDAVRVIDQVDANAEFTRTAFSISNNGVLVFRPAISAAATRLVWMDRRGVELEELGQPGNYTVPVLSPDEKTLAIARASDIWLMDLSRGTFSRFTFSSTCCPVWSPDSKRLAYRRQDTFDLHIKRLTDSDEAEPLMKTPETEMPATDWSPDGKVLLYSLQSPETKDDLWTVPVSGEIKPAPYLRGPFDEVQGRFSPDGRWVAYASNESGQFEVYVQSFPAGQGKWQISTSGGADPRWRRDGKELYFISPDRKIMAIDVTTSPAFEPKIARPLFPAAVSGMTDVRTHYAVTHDGQRFLVNKLLDTSGSTPLTVVLNWTATLKK